MAETKRLSDRNKLIQELLTDGKGLMNFYRFVAQNPHINLHDACQIVINRPNASVCFLFSEWNEMDRRIIKGRKGIPYYDETGISGLLLTRTIRGAKSTDEVFTLWAGS